MPRLEDIHLGEEIPGKPALICIFFFFWLIQPFIPIKTPYDL